MMSPGSGASAGRLRSVPLAVQRRDRMPAERTTMRQVREVLRLKFVGGVPIREIARRIGVAASTVRTTIKRFHTAGLSWPLPEEMTDAALEARLFADAGTKQGHRRQVEPDWASIHSELKRKHVTLSILWDEYIARHPEGSRQSQPRAFFYQPFSPPASARWGVIVGTLVHQPDAAYILRAPDRRPRHDQQY